MSILYGVSVENQIYFGNSEFFRLCVYQSQWLNWWQCLTPRNCCSLLVIGKWIRGLDVSKRQKVAGHLMQQKLIEYMLPRCWLFSRKNLSSASQGICVVTFVLSISSFHIIRLPPLCFHFDSELSAFWIGIRSPVFNTGVYFAWAELTSEN